MRKHFKEIISAKEHAIVHHIQEQDKLNNELKYINVEKKVMEKMLRKRFETAVFLSTETQSAQRNTE
jgi:hypothetical protein